MNKINLELDLQFCMFFAKDFENKIMYFPSLLGTSYGDGDIAFVNMSGLLKPNMKK